MANAIHPIEFRKFPQVFANNANSPNGNEWFHCPNRVFTRRIYPTPDLLLMGFKGEKPYKSWQTWILIRIN